ncbi:MAG: hypothetical protein GY772_20320 [bacterium]|nr:hypothetical protein [bacterium]
MEPSVEAWVRYYVATEEFDRMLPGVWSPYSAHSWLPLPSSKGESSRFARRLIRQMAPGHRRDVRTKMEALDMAERAHLRDRSAAEALVALGLEVTT